MITSHNFMFRYVENIKKKKKITFAAKQWTLKLSIGRELLEVVASLGIRLELK